MFHPLSYIVLAAGNSSGSSAISTFFASTLGGIVSAFMAVAGVALVLFAIVKSVKDVTAGKVSSAVKTIALSMIFAAILFAPGTMLGGIVDGFSAIASGISDLFKTTANK